jgi:folate-binding protein YgfZ
VIVAIRRDVLTIGGADAATFLQGQVSQDVEALTVGASAWSLLLSPQGKVVAFGRITRVDDSTFAYDVEPGFGQVALDRLSRFKLRVDVELSLENAVDGIAVRDVVLPSADATLTLPASWPDHDGTDMIGAALDDSAAAALDSITDLEHLRIEAGVPKLGAELDDSTIPAEAGRWLIDQSVSFTKGCYVGQELVARVDSRGSNTPRRLRRIRSVDGSALEAGSEITVDGNAVGRVTSAARDVALGYVGRSVDVPGTGTVGVGEVSIEEL